jgi:hypothetical protein
MRQVFGLALLLVFVLVPLGACSRVEWQARFFTPNTIPVGAANSFLKCHQKNGDLIVLDTWELDAAATAVSGKGIRYDAQRTEAGRGGFTIPLASIVFFETNRPESVVGTDVAVMAVFSAASASLSLACLANPKACFGSCPTFYAFDGQRPVLVAEGFSSSIAKVFEATDVDALYAAKATGATFELVMRNEALETHAVRQVNLLHVAHRPGERVFRTAEGAFYTTRSRSGPRTCESMRGDCVSAVATLDDAEYRSPAGERDLAARERLELVFAPVPGAKAVVIGARNTLLNTFLFYQALAYMGSAAGDWMAQLEQGDPKALAAAGSVGRLLGDVDVFVQMRSGNWERAGAFFEVGPIARDVQLITLPPGAPEGEVHVRLELTRGNWKVDYVALAALGERVEPVRIPAATVIRNGVPDARALHKLRDPDAYLMTFPGDEYTLRFDVPGAEAEFFLESRGYYYEWMRSQWLTEENPREVARLFLAPSDALRKLAPAYKQVENEMEAIFWQSKFGARP